MTIIGDATVHDAEVSRFDGAAEAWWGHSGPARWLHRYNAVRVPYIRDAACRQFARDTSKPLPLRDLSVLDIGCGGGVLCEPLAGMGATVTGVDPAANAIAIARAHARANALAIDYRAALAETLVAAGERFDVVLAMEVVEHVADYRLFAAQCAALTRPGGVAIFSTINRTVKSYVFAIAMGEYVLRLLPPGTHRWRDFVRPQELGSALAGHGLDVADVSGVVFDPLTRAMKLSPKLGVNYLLTAVSGAAPAMSEPRG